MENHIPQDYVQDTRTTEQINAMVCSFMNKVYLWLALSMVISAGVAIYVESDIQMMSTVLDNRIAFGIGTLAVVLIMCFAAGKLTSGALKLLMIVYSVLQGAVLSPLLHIYSNESLGLTFACTAGMFGTMAIFGMVTKANLSGMGRTLFMLLIGLIIAIIANHFIGSSMMSLGISAAGVIIFALFTAYDFQVLKEQGAYITDPAEREKCAILGCLNLYINFYNIFLFLLRFLGSADE